MRIVAGMIGRLARLASGMHMAHAAYHDWRVRTHEGRVRVHEKRRKDRLAEASRIDTAASGLIEPKRLPPPPKEPTKREPLRAIVNYHPQRREHDS